MECNKDEATRAKEIAERKFTAKDIAGAKKFALKAQNLYPGLDGLPQMLATLDVYISAENKISGEADWYGILGVNPLADDETVKKQYRKLALMLHPDKNKSVGADGAFKLISEAWSLLSDKAKRTAYDQKRNSKGFQQKVPPSGGVPPAPPGANGFYNFTNNTTSNAKPPKSGTRVGTASAPASSHPSKPNTFWTACHRCKMQYEYLRVYLNHNLLCPNCHEPFLAVETAPPPSNGSNSSTPWSFSQQRQNSNHHTTNKNSYNQGRNSASTQNMGPGGFAGLDSFSHTNFQWGPFSKTTGVGNSTTSASATAQAATVVQQAYEKVKRQREEAQAAARREEALRRKNHVSKKMGSGSSTSFSNSASSPVAKGERPMKKRRGGIDDNGGNCYSTNGTNQTAMGNGVGVGSISGLRHSNFETERVNGVSTNKPNSIRELSQSELRNMLMEKAKLEIRKKLTEWSSAAIAKPSDKDKDKEKDKEKEKEKATLKGEVGDQNESGESLDTKKKIHSKKDFPGTCGTDSDTEALEPMSISVPDPDFHDFDKDRTERSFGDNQVWAAYDDDDGMPRYYAMIHTVISSNPFKMRISWLNSKTNSELGPLNWVGCGFSKICGDFRVGRHEVNDSLNSFSHRVRWTKGMRGAIRIFPKKGDIWALYRNWSPDWNELTPDEVIHKYDMVEVLDDYMEEHGVVVTPLVKVAGFKTVFHRHLDPGQVRTIPREEMFRFSHQVPSYLLTGQEAPNAPKGCRELDPAATPLELLQVITDVREEEIVEDAEKNMEKETSVNGEKVKEEHMQSIKEDKEKEMMENTKKTKEEVMVGKGNEAKEEKMVEFAEEQKAS
ncbi:PREDICTED: uncharacterized protein LOC104591743 [Nelumbo nucifera]|uniref:Uncharacterized protein LOC104591743 n=1 Tax=Nelumbo nucifera TaxID=4432 RepID=A0A1U7ZM67_NELNU|nr:PREDICTED: uncharacterized protein LOC104591743 [Nelumbo nucifera]